MLGISMTLWRQRLSSHKCRVNEILLPGRQCSSSWSAPLVQTKGCQRSFQPSMKVSMAAMRPLTEVKVPRRIACLVMNPKKIR